MTHEMQRAIARVPLWKKLLLCCVVHNRKWRTARRIDKVARFFFLRDHPLFETLRDESDKLWLEIYGLAPEQPRT